MKAGDWVYVKSSALLYHLKEYMRSEDRWVCDLWFLNSGDFSNHSTPSGKYLYEAGEIISEAAAKKLIDNRSITSGQTYELTYIGSKGRILDL